VIVVHREAMVAEGIAAALGRYPSIVPIAAVTSAAEGEQHWKRADAVAIDYELPGAEAAAKRLRQRGVRVVLIGDVVGETEEGNHVSPHMPVASLASALVPNAGFLPSSSEALTRRQREVLALVARGLAGKQVARHLGISPKTVEQHKSRIFAKLGVPNQTAAVSLASASTVGGRTIWSLSNI
jgi:DNA-binding NarL/FixJ family response regulator